jgi:hypothetical protein
MPPQEKAEAMKVIESAKKPTAETLIMIVKGIELLINAAP